MYNSTGMMLCGHDSGLCEDQKSFLKQKNNLTKSGTAQTPWEGEQTVMQVHPYTSEHGTTEETDETSDL